MGTPTASGKNKFVVPIVVVVIIFVVGIGYLLSIGAIPLGGSSGVASGTTTTSITGPATTGVLISGSITTSGQGTQTTNLVFSGTPGSFDVPVSNGHYQFSDLPAPATYSVSAKWTGAYSWQSGTVSLSQVNIQSSSPSVVQDFQVSTPNSNITLSGSVATTGAGTQPVTVILTHAGTNYTAAVANGQYSLSVPNLAKYATYVHWSGTYPWQSQDAGAGQLQVNQAAGSGSQSSNIQADTPDSVIQVSGSITPSGSQTTAVGITFSTSGGQSFSSPVGSDVFSTQLPNLAAYSVQVQWSGAYSWQSGTVAASPGEVTISQGAGSNSQSVPINVNTPDSVITMSGSVTATGSGTRPLSVELSGNGVDVPATVNSGQYSAQVPNLASFSVSVSWAGSYSWQTGSVAAGSVSVNLPAGFSESTFNIVANTPPSTVTVSGSISTTFGTSQNLITFDMNGMIFNATPVSGSYSILLPNIATFTVSVNWSGWLQSGTCYPSPDTYYLDALAGTTSIGGVDWSC